MNLCIKFGIFVILLTFVVILSWIVWFFFRFALSTVAKRNTLFKHMHYWVVLTVQDLN